MIKKNSNPSGKLLEVFEIKMQRSLQQVKKDKKIRCISKISCLVSGFPSCQQREKEIEKLHEPKKKVNPVFHFKFQYIHGKDICGGIFGWQKCSINLANLRRFS